MTTTARPEFVSIWLRCKACGKDWDDWQPIMVPVTVWVAYVKTYRCPHCGAGGRNVLLRPRPSEEPSA
jgi:hypothetical protein